MSTNIQLDLKLRLENSFNKLAYQSIPERMRGALISYVIYKSKPGDFLTSLICNRLKETFAYADPENKQLIRVYIDWFYNETYGVFGEDNFNKHTWHPVN